MVHTLWCHLLADTHRSNSDVTRTVPCVAYSIVLQVNIWVPQPEKQLDVIKVTGLAANVERAKLGLLERVKELQAEQEDRVIFKMLAAQELTLILLPISTHLSV